MFEASLRKFHPNIPLIHIDEEKVKTYQDPMFYYRASPIIAQKLLKEYSVVIKADADQIICDDISELWLPDDSDVSVVNNTSPRDFQTFPYQFLNIAALSYVNCGLVVMRSQAFVDEWYDMCHSILFSGMQMKEQDILNILVHGNHYKIKRLDEGDNFWGMAYKGYEPDVIMKDGKMFLDKGINPENWPDKPKTLKIWHSGGGNAPDKMNYRIKFQPEVIKKLDELIK